MRMHRIDTILHLMFEKSIFFGKKEKKNSFFSET